MDFTDNDKARLLSGLDTIMISNADPEIKTLRDRIATMPTISPEPAWVHPYDRPGSKCRAWVENNAITNPMAITILRNMAEIDNEITHVDEAEQDNDRPPEGDDYNDLWDHVLDGIAQHAIDPPDADVVSAQAMRIRDLVSDNNTLLQAIKPLIEWMRDFTSPRDETGPHAILIAAVEAVDKVEDTQ